MNSSKNEVIIAIFLGIFVGLISVFAFYFVAKKTNFFALRPLKVSVPIKEDKNAAKTDKQIVESFELQVTPLENEIISEVPEFKISGTVNKPAEIIVQTDNLSKIVTAGASGDFETSLELKSEINEIFVTAVAGGDARTIEKIVYYQKK